MNKPQIVVTDITEQYKKILRDDFSLELQETSYILCDGLRSIAPTMSFMPVGFILRASYSLPHVTQPKSFFDIAQMRAHIIDSSKTVHADLAFYYVGMGLFFEHAPPNNLFNKKERADHAHKHNQLVRCQAYDFAELIKIYLLNQTSFEDTGACTPVSDDLTSRLRCRIADSLQGEL